jgi:hypothetical protein
VESAVTRVRLHSWAAAGLILAAVGIALRLNNAFRYPPKFGFDASFNWEYIALLMQSWRLPAPDELWATAHPPLFYYLSAAIGRALVECPAETTVHAVRLLSTGMGLVTVAFTVLLVRRADPHNPQRALIAGALLLFLPVHIYMSAMLSEEILVSSLASIAIAGVAWDLLQPASPRAGVVRAAALGAVAGLAFLTKLSGALAIVAAMGAYLIDGWQRRDWRPALSRAAVLGIVATAVGGWFYARNWVQYGYVYPYGLEVHSIMFTMPPGFRSLGDYFRIPWATISDPNLLSPDLLHSVWGSTYITVWFDGHRHFLPRSGIAVERLGTAILLLGLVPTAAFVVGTARGARRILKSVPGPDAVLLLLVAVTLAGYAVFTWRNPWFVCVKASFLLGLSVPFAYYASDILASWIRSGRLRSALLWVSLGLLALLVTVTFSYHVCFWKAEFPGIKWAPVETPWHR